MIKYFKGMTPWTRRVIVICAAAVLITFIVCAAISGSMGDFFNLILEVVK